MARGAARGRARARSRTAVAVVAVGLLAGACGVGTGTLRIADAEALIVGAAEEIVREARLVDAGEVRSAPLEQCTLRTGGPGLRTRVAVRALLPGTGDAALAAAFDAAAGVLVARDLVLVESGVPGTLLGQRDGIMVTIGSDGRTLEFDALTGCRPR